MKNSNIVEGIEKLKVEGVSRRDLFGRVAAAGAGVALTSTLAGLPLEANAATRSYLSLPYDTKPRRASIGMFRDSSYSEAIEKLVNSISDMSWLKSGDRVLIKVASNSHEPHPSVTDPNAVIAMVNLLKSRGAGEVVVADQAGVEWVRRTKTKRRSSTREIFQKNGLMGAVLASGATFHGFDDNGFDQGYFKPEFDFQNHWEEKLYLPNILNDVDHIIYMPRIGAHALCQYTLSMKMAIGFLRDDSRLFLHNQANDFYLRVPEVSHVPIIRNKFRFAVSLVSKILASFGPDWGDKIQLPFPLGVASTNLIDHDFLSLQLVKFYDRKNMTVFDSFKVLPQFTKNYAFTGFIWGAPVLATHKFLPQNFFSTKIERSPLLSHKAVLEGVRPRTIEVTDIGNALDPSLSLHLSAVGLKPTKIA